MKNGRLNMAYSLYRCKRRRLAQLLQLELKSFRGTLPGATRTEKWCNSSSDGDGLDETSKTSPLLFL